eukprot:scaffold5527_cov161-Ochromonas_danica.AAC.1
MKTTTTNTSTTRRPSSFQMIAEKLTLKKKDTSQRSMNTDISNNSSNNSSDDWGGDFSETDDDFTSSEKTSTQGDRKGGFLSSLHRVARKGGKVLVRAVINYGPPYNKAGFDVALINECARPVLNHLELHSLLNARINPNLPDPEDLYYTPMHWCARNGHLLGMKMLRRAGAVINVTNEMGVTPLDLIIMMKHSPDRRKLQLQMVEYLLENGADVNNIDKGGFSAIDHAAMNQDLEIIEMLLAHGAKVRRDNQILVAKRKPILDLVHDPDCYRTLYEALLAEEREVNQKKLERERKVRVKQEEQYYEKIHLALNKRKLKREQREQKEDEEMKANLILSKRLEIMQKEADEQNQLKMTKQEEQFTVWKKVMDTSSSSTGTVHSQWKREMKTRTHVTGQMIYNSNREVMHQLQRDNDVFQYNGLWRKLTGGGNLEVKWPRCDAFLMDEDEGRSATSTISTGPPPSFLLEGSIVPPSTITTASLPSALSHDIDYHDENDDTLGGEDDLDSLLNDLKSL